MEIAALTGSVFSGRQQVEAVEGRTSAESSPSPHRRLGFNRR
jgi:hypothetical protein